MHRARLRAENQGQPDMSVLVWRGWWYRVAWRCFASGAETWVFLFLYLPIQRARMRTCFEKTWGQNLRKCLQVCASHATRLSVSPIDLPTNLAQKNALCLCLFVAPRALCCA